MATPADRERERKLKSLLSDLGRATMRGVRRCPQCGTLNGTRGNACKNKHCNVKFREKSTAVKSKTAARLDTGTSGQVLYSVRVRESGVEMRGFVQLPDRVMATQMGEPRTEPCCHVTSCQKLRARQREGIIEPPCRHVAFAGQCTNRAVPLMLKNSVLSNREDLAEIRSHLWNLATETSGPLVQRVSRSYMVVKCKPSRQFPLGYLHAYFSLSHSNRTSFFCPCPAFRHSSQRSEERRCLHVHACFCAFLSSEALSAEFAYFVSLDETARQQARQSAPVPLLSELVEVAEAADTLPVLDVASVADAGADGLCEVEVEVLEDPAVLQAAGLQTLEYGEVRPGQAGAVTLQLGARPVPGAPHTVAVRAGDPARFPGSPDGEAALSCSFYQWLGSVTERINQTMHYQCDGRPDPLVFHVPHVFFAALKERIAHGVKKRRLPNQVTSFTRSDLPPIGTFTKYTWHITNILRVKSIFDGPHIQLNITRSFQYCTDTGRYTEHVPSEAELAPPPAAHKLIKPQQYKTVLRVGCISAQQQEPTPFVIEWVPGVLPRSQVGELRLEFQFVHQRNGQLVEAPELSSVPP